MRTSSNRIIDATIGLICRYGYHGTSIQMIARKVGLNKSTILYHFASKEAILLAILDLAFPKMLHQLTMLVNDEKLSGKEKLRKFIELHMNNVATNGDVLSVYLREEHSLSSQNLKMHIDSRKHYARLIRKIIRQIQEEDEESRFSELSSAIITNAILGVCNWSVRWYKKRGSMSLEEVCQQLHKIIGIEMATIGNTEKTV